MAEDEIFRNSNIGQIEPEPETPCDFPEGLNLERNGLEQCNNSATYRITYFKPGRRRTKAELNLCDLHFTKWKLEKHKYAYSIRQLKG